MKNTIKRGIALALSLLTLFAFFVVPISRVSAATMYNNVINVSASSSVSSGGLLQTALYAIGTKGVTSRIIIELYVEKRILGVFWSKVEIGVPDNVWIDSVNSHIYNNTFSTQLNSSGTYRVTVTFTISGSGGPDDIITKQNTVTY